nr:reverse transcriptase domain-containing protein [Tanacetum cinerariifolium]
MQTRSSSRLVSNPSSNPTPSTNSNLKGRNRRRSKQRIEDFNLEELYPPIVTMADQRTMAQLLQAPTEGYEDAIVVPAITVDNFGLKHGLLTLVQNKILFGHDKEDPHAPRIWLEKEPPRSIFTWDDLVLKFINQFFPPSKTTNIRNEITNFQQRFDESFSEAWDRFKDLIRSSPHHGFSELHQLDTFYNALNSKDQDSLNSVAGVSTNTSTSGISPDVAELKDMVKALLLDKKGQNQSPAPVKAVDESCVTCGVNYNQGNTSCRPPMMSNQIRPLGFPLVVENKPEATKDTVNPTNNGSTEDLQPQVVQSESPILTSEPVTSPISEPVIDPIFKDMSFEISFVDALILISKFASTLKALIGNKEKLGEMARTPLNEHCSVILLKKLPDKLGDPGKFLIPCDFPGMAECLALADLGASINLMPFSVWKRLSLPDLTPTYMSLELADRSISRPVGITKEVYVKVGKLTLQVGKEAINFNLDQTSRYSTNYSDMTAKRIDVIDMACEEYSQEVLGFSDVIASGNPTSYYDLIVSTTFSTLTPFRNSDFLLEEVDAFLAVEDDPISLEFYQPFLDPEGDILLLEEFLNDDQSLPPPNQGNYLPKVRTELKICEAKSDKSSIDEPPEVELKDLPPYLKYAFLEGDDKLPVIIAKDLSMEEKTTLITVLKSHKRAITWKLSYIKGIDPKFYTHKILMEEDFELAVQHQRRVNPKIHDVIKQEVIKLLEAGLIYPISDSPWVSPVHCVPKKGGFTVVENEDNELIWTRLVTVVHAFEKFRSYPIMNKSIVYTDHSALKYLFAKKDSKAKLLRWVLLLQEFTFKVLDTKGAENLAADHLSLLENPHQNVLDPKEINKSFLLRHSI